MNRLTLNECPHKTFVKEKCGCSWGEYTAIAVPRCQHYSVPKIEDAYIVIPPGLTSGPTPVRSTICSINAFVSRLGLLRFPPKDGKYENSIDKEARLGSSFSADEIGGADGRAIGSILGETDWTAMMKALDRMNRLLEYPMTHEPGPSFKNKLISQPAVYIVSSFISCVSVACGSDMAQVGDQASQCLTGRNEKLIKSPNTESSIVYNWGIVN